MLNEIKLDLARKALQRGSSGIYFIDEILRNRSGSTDAAFSRSWYILLSFNFELILKAILILESPESTKEEILQSIKSHDLKKLCNTIQSDNLKKYGISSIQESSEDGFKHYIISTKDCQITIQDLIDVRYDFEKDALRKTNPDEIDMIKKEIKSLFGIIDTINKFLYPTNI